jgi:UDP-glucuronate 4-epimerase
MIVLVTGAAGFIGFHLTQRLLGRGDSVVGIDNLNDYYPVALKRARLAEIGDNARFRFEEMDIADRRALPELFEKEKFDAVVNLAAQAGVRYSIENPWAYVESNLVGFVNVLECCRHYPVKHLVYASSSSVYGGNEKTPFSEEDKVDNPVSLYAATKKSNELMASCYCKLYGIRATGLRFFTVYGPWGRPDMSPMLFASAISAGRPIKVFNNGDMMRDFTYVDDIVEGVTRVLDKAPEMHEVYNIGCSNPVKLMDFISEIESAVGHPAEKIMLPMQPGDVYQTYADTSKLECDFGYKPGVTLHEGIARFIEWYKSDKNPLR